MEYDRFQEWQSAMKQLDPAQKQHAQGLLHLKIPATMSLETLEARLAEQRQCPHCNAATAISRGTSRGLRRYSCKTCKKTFNAATNTVLRGLQKKNKWLMFRECIAEGLSGRAAARRCNLAASTASRWQHRFLNMQNAHSADTIKPIPKKPVDQVRIREIRKTVLRHFRIEILSTLNQELEFPCLFEELQTTLNFILNQSGPDTVLGIAMMAILRDLRSQGLVRPCLNNGPRHVPSMEAWNIWVTGGDEAENLSHEDLYHSPAFIGIAILRF